MNFYRIFLRILISFTTVTRILARCVFRVGTSIFQVCTVTVIQIFILGY